MADKLARAKLARAALRFAARSGSALPPLILMTDDDRLADPFGAARALPRGSMVILRAHESSRRRELAAKLKRIAKSHGLKLLVADDPYLSAQIAADGLHLPEKHAWRAAHWRARHPHWIITAAAHSAKAIIAARHAHAVIVGPVFATASHPGKATLGATRFRGIARHSPLPVYALGGIEPRTAQGLAAAKLAGLAAIGALAV